MTLETIAAIGDDATVPSLPNMVARVYADHIGAPR
jgi:hypothetical protein